MMIGEGESELCKGIEDRRRVGIWWEGRFARKVFDCGCRAGGFTHSVPFIDAVNVPA